MRLPKGFVWVKGFKKRYAVNRDGDVWSVPRPANAYRGGFLSFQKHDGYYSCKLGKKKRFRIHRVVASAFIPNPENKPQVNHINSIRTDNRVENLEWCTNYENWEHGMKYGNGEKAIEIYRRATRKLSYAVAEEIRERYKTEPISQETLGAEYGIDQTTVSRIILKKTYYFE